MRQSEGETVRHKKKRETERETRGQTVRERETKREGAKGIGTQGERIRDGVRDKGIESETGKKTDSERCSEGERDL